MQMECYWSPPSCIHPQIVQLYEIGKNYIRGKGYSIVESDILPISRILTLSTENGIRQFYVQITHILNEQEDIQSRCERCEQGLECNPEEDHMQLFPSDTLTVKYNIVKEITNAIDYKHIAEHIEQLEEAVVQNNDNARNARLQQEQINREEYCKTLKYSEFLKKIE